jgi:plastocyanin
MEMSDQKSAYCLPILATVILFSSVLYGSEGCQCAGDLSVTVQRSAASRATTSVSETEYQFTAKSITINQGDTVTWTNNGSIPHTSTSDSGVWDSGSMNPGTSFSFTFNSAGSFPYHCSFHQNLGMVGTVTVNAVAPATPSITSPLTATAMVGAAFSYTITANGTAPITFSAAPLPAGLSFSTATISGTPTTQGTFNITLTAMNAAGTDTQTLVLTVNPGTTVGTTPPVPTSPTNNGGTIKFSVKASDTNGSRSKFQIDKIDISSMASQLPSNRGKPTLAGLSNMYLYLGSAVFTGTVDSKGKVSGPFSARLAGGRLLTIQAKGLDLVSLLGLDLTTDGTKTVPENVAVVATDSTGTAIVLFSGFGGTGTITYTVKKGTGTAK